MALCFTGVSIKTDQRPEKRNPVRKRHDRQQTAPGQKVHGFFSGKIACGRKLCSVYFVSLLFTYIRLDPLNQQWCHCGAVREHADVLYTVVNVKKFRCSICHITATHQAPSEAIHESLPKNIIFFFFFYTHLYIFLLNQVTCMYGFLFCACIKAGQGVGEARTSTLTGLTSCQSCFRLYESPEPQFLKHKCGHFLLRLQHATPFICFNVMSRSSRPDISLSPDTELTLMNKFVSEHFDSNYFIPLFQYLKLLFRLIISFILDRSLFQSDFEIETDLGF